MKKKLKNALKEIEPPVQIEVPTKKLDNGYAQNYTEVGRFWLGDEEMVVLGLK